MNFIRLEGHNDDKIRLKQVEKFWTTDFVDSISSTKVPVSREGKQALRIMEGSSKFVSGHYQIALPWRKQPPHLSNNKLLAVQRLQLVKKNFFVIPNYLKATRGLFMTTSQRTTPNEYLCFLEQERLLLSKAFIYLICLTIVLFVKSEKALEFARKICVNFEH